MTWYKLIFKQNQPIHIGGSKWGVLNETILFISGFTMWGALTNAYLLENPSSEDELERIKKYFETITCFYPSFNKENILEPKFERGKFYLGGFLEEEFRFYFTDSLVRTAIEPINRGSKEEALYELEFVLPKPKKEFLDKVNGFIDNLYWIGLIGIEEKNSKDIENFLKNGLKVYVGGDVRYGFGELELVKIEKIEEDKIKDWNLDKEGKLCLNNEKKLVNFLEFNNNIKFKGKLILIPELEFSENLPKVEDAKFFISPGSKIKEEGNKEKYILKKGKFVYNGGYNEERS